MNDCVFANVCDWNCGECSAYLSMNTEEGLKLYDEYWLLISKATEPVRQWLEIEKKKRLEKTNE